MTAAVWTLAAVSCWAKAAPSQGTHVVSSKGLPREHWASSHVVLASTQPLVGQAQMRGGAALRLRGGDAVLSELPQCSKPPQAVRHDGAELGDETAGQSIHMGGFPILTATNGEAMEVASLCMNCDEQGTTRILPTTIPRFGQVVIMAFECYACNYTSNDVQNAADVKPLGVHYSLCVNTRDDLDRQIIKSEHATICLPGLDFEIPPITQAGSLSTVEGVLTHAAKSLEYMQPQRRAVDAATADKIQHVIDELRELSAGTRPFHLALDDLYIIYIYICTYIYTRIYTYVYMYIYIYVYTTYVHIYVHACYMNIYKYSYIYIYIYIHAHQCIPAHVCRHVYMYINICIFISIYMNVNRYAPFQPHTRRPIGAEHCRKHCNRISRSCAHFAAVPTNC